jgi:cytochrome c553
MGLRRLLLATTPALILITTSGTAQQGPSPELTWAFPQMVPMNELKPVEDDGKPRRIPGSTREYTQKQIDELFNAPDWFPDEHPPFPKAVQFGNAPTVQACAKCHLANGQGHPESASLTGLSAAYMIRQMAEFKSDVRKNGQPMNHYAKNLSDEDVRQSSEYFAKLKPGVWYKVIEARTVPKTHLNVNYKRLATPDGAMEPIGNRIITVPEDAFRNEARDPHSGYIAYVPPGSLGKGEALVKTGGGGKTVACAICHGPDLRGIGEVPRIAGQHPIYIVRQLYNFKNGHNSGPWSLLMRQSVARLTDEDIVSIAAYVGSLAP